MKIGLIRLPETDSSSDLIYIIQSRLKVDYEDIPFWNPSIPNNCEILVIASNDLLTGIDDIIKTNEYPVVRALAKLNDPGKRIIIGIGGGFRLLCMIKLLPGEVEINKDKMFISRMVYLRSETTQSVITALLNANRPLHLPLAHLYGRFTASPDELRSMRQNNQIIFRYCDKNGTTSLGVNADGSIDNIAAISNEYGNIIGISPHIERASTETFNGTDGLAILESLIASVL
jgi:phosphoribosylformylglycinamidine synthase subunit PurQ / glutaminase